MPTWSGLQQADLSCHFFQGNLQRCLSLPFVEVKYGNGKLCKADKDPLDVPQCSLALKQHPPVVADPDKLPKMGGSFAFFVF